MNGQFPVIAFLFGWLDRQGDFTAILTGFGLFFLGIYIWRITLAHRREKQKKNENAPAKEEDSVDFKNPYSEKMAVEKEDTVGKSFDHMLSKPVPHASRAFRVYVPHTGAELDDEQIQAEEANRVYIWE